MKKSFLFMMVAALLFAANQMYAQFEEESVNASIQDMRFGGPDRHGRHGRHGGPGGHGGRGDMVQRRIKCLTEQLQLTKEQAAKIESIYKEQDEERKARMEKFRQSGERPDMNAMREQMNAERAKTDAKIAEILTPEQNAKYLQLQSCREKNRMPNNCKGGDKCRKDAVSKMQSELNLSDEQVGQIKQIMAAKRKQDKADMDKVLRQVLTKEQYAKFKEMEQSKCADK